MRFLYTILFYLALPFVFLRLLWRARHLADNRKRWLERLGFCPFQLKESIWVHAVSVGEVIAAVPLIKKLRKEYPHIPVVVTTMTVTGSARVCAALGDSVFHCFIPYDLPDALARFLKRVNPRIALILETELWPNLFAATKCRGIPIVIVNACLSERSMKGYKKIPFLMHNMFSAIHVVGAQTQVDAERFISLGMHPDKVAVIGSVKFDLDVPSTLLSNSLELRRQLGKDRFVWVAGSTHVTEEEIILAAHRMIKTVYPSALLILVPRHPERFHAVSTLCEQEKWIIAHRSRNEVCDEKTDIYLCDTMGELLLMYGAGDIAFVGGSFAHIGGHNILEPAVLRKPIVTGPFLFNISEMSEMLLAANGMRVVNNAKELAHVIQCLFSNADLRQQVGENAYHVIEANRGVLDKQMELIKNIL